MSIEVCTMYTRSCLVVLGTNHSTVLKKYLFLLGSKLRLLVATTEQIGVKTSKYGHFLDIWQVYVGMIELTYH